MTRSNYDVYADATPYYASWRSAVHRSIRGKIGQSFLRELASEMDKMEVKELIADELINRHGGCCALGVIFKSRCINTSFHVIDKDDAKEIAKAINISWSLASEIEFMNDEAGPVLESPAHRWSRMRGWVDEHIKNK